MYVSSTLLMHVVLVLMVLPNFWNHCCLRFLSEGRPSIGSRMLCILSTYFLGCKIYPQLLWKAYFNGNRYGYLSSRHQACPQTTQSDSHSRCTLKLCNIMSDGRGKRCASYDGALWYYPSFVFHDGVWLYPRICPWHGCES
jgi:hypothetical protein